MFTVPFMRMNFSGGYLQTESGNLTSLSPCCDWFAPLAQFLDGADSLLKTAASDRRVLLLVGDEQLPPAAIGGNGALDAGRAIHTRTRSVRPHGGTSASADAANR